MTAWRHAKGFTLVELMIGLTLGLITTLAITQIMVNFQSQRRTTTSAMDAQVNDMLALATLRQSIEMAGYGFASEPAALDCLLDVRFQGTALAGWPVRLVPLVIANGADGSPDAVRVIGSSKATFSIPIRISATYDPLVDQSFAVASVRGVQAGDLMVAVSDPSASCETFQVSADPGTQSRVEHADGKWNSAGFPTHSYVDGNFLVNLGRLSDVTYSIGGNGTLQSTMFTLSDASEPAYLGPVDLYSHIVNLQAYYGKDTSGDGAIDTWNTLTPGNGADWHKVLAVRVALVSRSGSYEKDIVTRTNPVWDVGGSATVDDSSAAVAACGSSQCVTLRVDHLPDWQHYRYKVLDSVIPLRNLIWKS